MEGLGINPSEIGRKHGYFIKESFSNSISPILEKLQRAFLASEFKNKRLRIAYRFHINICEVSCVLPFDAGIFDVEALKIAASFISIIAETLIDDYIDLVEADKVIFSFDRGSNKWKFVFTSKNDGTIITSDYGKIYQDVEQKEFVAKKLASSQDKDSDDA